MMFVVLAMLSCRGKLKDNVLIRHGVAAPAFLEDGKFHVVRNGKSVPLFLKGVNMGAAKPGSFPGEFSITKEEYRRWFEWIGAMNANVIRIYTTMMPVFYEELLRYNQTHDRPLYLIQGVYLDEEQLRTIHDPYAQNRKILEEFVADAVDASDVIHGKAVLPYRAGHAFGTYRANVSDYVIAWILGVEWSGELVEETNRTHPDLVVYRGDYLEVEHGSAFECFLAEVGDRLLRHEAETHRSARPLAFTNWPTTDPLVHDNEPDPREDFAAVDVERIHATRLAFAGQFASYHVYPYYPEFLNYQPEFAEWIDPITLEPNPYRAYLEALKAHHDLPVLVSEFGIPSSRGSAHEGVVNGFDQGNHTEAEQGRILERLYRSIVEADLMGGIVFSWQDEWFKRTWNTMDYDLEWRRPFWSNAETNEQAFGLLAFDSARLSPTIVLDGNASDWAKVPVLAIADGIMLKAAADERYLYVLAMGTKVTVDQAFHLPFDTIPLQGNNTDLASGLRFARGVDFLLKVDGFDQTRLFVDLYYDRFDALYGYAVPSGFPGPIVPNLGVFSPIRHALSSALYLPKTNEAIPFRYYEAGLLLHGTTDRNASNFDSLTDFSLRDGVLEIRIPWLILNVMDPSTHQIMADFRLSKSFSPMTVEGFWIGASFEDAVVPMTLYRWNAWEQPIYVERLKESYYRLKEVFQSTPA
jgi:hypothetical protein